MLSQDVIQVYTNCDGDAVVVVGLFEMVGKPVRLEHITIPFSEIKPVAKALNKIAKQAIEDLE